jgi:uncharacterized protein YggE
MRNGFSLYIYFMTCAFVAMICCLLLVPGPRPKTSLSLSATGTSITAPDEMTASLSVQATAAAAAKAVSGVTTTTGAYSVYQPDAGKPEYQASQALELTMPAPGGAPPEAFTGLTGNLQQQGLLLNNLDGQLSPAGQDHAAQEATTDALQRLRAQAASIAATLGDSVGPIKTLNIDGGNPAPMPMGRMMMAMASPPPQSAPGPVTVQVTVTATIELKPRTP